MRIELAGQVLDRLVPWTDEERSARLPRLYALASIKWDRYEGFRTGRRFVESLMRWIVQFPEHQRMRWLDFVLDEMVFVSREELDHAMAVVYPGILRPRLLRTTADMLGISPHLHGKVMGHPLFRETQRRLLVLGLSDGARLDRLRRLCELSHEQFSLSYEVPAEAKIRMRETLRNALGCDDEEAYFRHLVLVDDFYGSGTSLIDHREDGTAKGKLIRLLEQAERLQKENDAGGRSVPPLLDPNGYDVSIVLYCASERAKRHIREHLDRASLDHWKLDVVQLFPSDCVVSDPLLVADCEAFYDGAAMDDEHKVGAALGYKACALSVVLFHNAPNNSISPLWSDTTGRSLDRHALFPRYERHHADRP